MLTALVLALGFLAWGCHVVVPFFEADDRPETRRRWRLIGLPLGLLAALAALLRVLSMPDSAIGAGLLPLGASRALPIALVAITLLLAVDVLLLIARDGAEALVWKLAAGVGLATLLAISGVEELLRIGSGPSMPVPAFVLAILVRTGIALVVGLAVANRLGGRSGLLAPIVGASMAIYLFLLPESVQSRLIGEGDVFTFGAAAILIGIARFVPQRLRRPTAIAGGILAALSLARAGELSQAVGERLQTVAGLVP